MTDTQSIIYAFLGGVLPAIFWLLFWLREDNKRPEPKGRIIETFIAGMAVVLLVLPFQRAVSDVFPDLGFVPFLLWATIEEVFKFMAVYVVAVRSRDDDEPIDGVIYMITGALGFAALENFLFIWNPLLEQNVTVALLTGGTRFLGASLLHTVASGALGIGLALSYFKNHSKKILYSTIGIFVATSIHTGFNMLLISGIESARLWAFVSVWILGVFLLLAFERVKAIAS
jgi:protease PrsW